MKKEEKPRRQIRTKKRKQKESKRKKKKKEGWVGGCRRDTSEVRGGLTLSLPLVGLAFLLDTTSFSTTPRKRCSDCVWKDTVPLGSFLMRTAWFL